MRFSCVDIERWCVVFSCLNAPREHTVNTEGPCSVGEFHVKRVACQHGAVRHIRRLCFDVARRNFRVSHGRVICLYVVWRRPLSTTRYFTAGLHAYNCIKHISTYQMLSKNFMHLTGGDLKLRASLRFSDRIRIVSRDEPCDIFTFLGSWSRQILFFEVPTGEYWECNPFAVETRRPRNAFCSISKLSWKYRPLTRSSWDRCIRRTFRAQLNRVPPILNAVVIGPNFLILRRWHLFGNCLTFSTATAWML